MNLEKASNDFQFFCESMRPNFANYIHKRNEIEKAKEDLHVKTGYQFHADYIDEENFNKGTFVAFSMSSHTVLAILSVKREDEEEEEETKNVKARSFSRRMRESNNIRLELSKEEFNGDFSAMEKELEAEKKQVETRLLFQSRDRILTAFKVLTQETKAKNLSDDEQNIVNELFDKWTMNEDFEAGDYLDEKLGIDRSYHEEACEKSYDVAGC